MKRFFAVSIAIILVALATPLFIFNQFENVIGYYYFLIWKAHRANAILFRYGWNARQLFLMSCPKSYNQFVTRVYG